MEVKCTLTILNDFEAEYEDDLFYKRETAKAVRGKLTYDPLTLRTVLRLKHWIEECEDKCSREELAVLGLHLYNIAFGSDAGSPIRMAFEETYETCLRQKAREPNSRLRLQLVIHSNATKLSTYPWEFLAKPSNERGLFLAGEDTSLILTRFVPGVKTLPLGQVEEGRLRILVVVSSPSPLTIADAPRVTEQLDRLPKAQYDVRSCSDPSKRSLMAEIADFEPHIMHFIGHGKEGGIYVKKEEEDFRKELIAYKASQITSKDAKPPEEAGLLDRVTVSSLFSGHRPRLVFLHACEGATRVVDPESLQSFNSVAGELALQGIPAVVAMQYQIEVGAAQQFAVSFYKEILDGKDIGEAVQKARIWLATKMAWQAWENRSFGAPVVYLQNEQPFIRSLPAVHPIARASDEPPRDQSLPERQLCPYTCGGSVFPSWKFCNGCRKALMPCPVCEAVIAREKGFCQECGYAEGAAPAGASAVAQGASHGRPQRPPQAPQAVPPRNGSAAVPGSGASMYGEPGRG